MDNSIALSDGGETTTMTITPTTSQYTQLTEKTQVPTPAPSLKLASLPQPPERSPPPSSPPTRTLLNACIIVLTVTSSMIVNVRYFSDDYPQVVNFFLQIANITAVSIALPTIEKEMNLEPAQLQWIMSAYSLSSVSKSRAPLPHRNPTHKFQFLILCPCHMDPTHVVIFYFRVASFSYAVD